MKGNEIAEDLGEREFVGGYHEEWMVGSLWYEIIIKLI